MDELDFDPERFLILAPVWHVVDGNNDVMVSTTAEGVKFITCFTDQDLAERFLARSNLPGSTTFAFPTPSTWQVFLEVLIGAGHRLIAIDPEQGHPLRIAPIQAVIDVLRRG